MSKVRSSSCACWSSREEISHAQGKRNPSKQLYTVNKTRSGADCGSHHEPFITKFRIKLKKVGETARPFRYDLDQIPYDYTVEVSNSFKGLDLIDRVPDELWNEVIDTV